jgi:hypothetical protein
MRVHIPCARATVASRSPTPTTGGSTPSERALCRTASPDTSTLTTAEASSSGPALPGSGDGSDAPWGAAARKAVVDPTQGVRFPPDPPRASGRTGKAPGSYPGGTGFEAQGAHRAAVAQPAGSTGPSSRRSRVQVPPVAPRRRGPMEKAPAYEAGGMQVRPLPSTPISP